MVELTWWKTFDYLTGYTYILGEKFESKGAAIAYAKRCGMTVIPQSTVPLTDLERENLLLKEQIKRMGAHSK